MRSAIRLSAMALIVLSLSGCGSTSAANFTRVSPSARASATISSGTASSARTPATPGTAVATCAPSTGHSLALVTLRGSDQVVVRDITDIAHPATIGTVSSGQVAVGAIERAIGFACSSVLAYLGGVDSSGLPTIVYTTPLGGSPATAVVSGNQPLLAFGWRADGRALAYITRVDDSALHIVQDGRDRAVGPAPHGALVGGCESAPCPPTTQIPPSDNWDVRLAFSPDGAYISMVQNSLNSNFRVWASEGRLITSLDQQSTTMSVWLGASLYFRDAKGVEVWRNGTVSTYLPGVAWIRPKASPDGSHIVYEARDVSGAARVFVLDIATKQVRDLGAARAEPAFLTSRYVWYETEPACVATGTCRETIPGPATATGKTYVYDLVNGTETESTITAVFDLWPRS